MSAILSALSLVSGCTTEEWSEFKRVDLEADGIDLEASYIDGYTATVPPEGATFTVTANGKGKERNGVYSRLFRKTVQLPLGGFRTPCVRPMTSCPRETGEMSCT